MVVNLTGRAVWGFLAAPRTVEEIAAYLTESFRGVSTEQAAEDAAGFIRALVPGYVQEIGADD